MVPVESGSKTLKDALNEAMRDWVTNVANTFYIIGTVAGPHPYPMMVRDFQRVIGRECLEQMPEVAGRQPDAVIACVGGGSNAIGIFYDYIPHRDVRLIGVEAGGHGLATGKHAASLNAGRPGVLHGNRTYLLQDEHGQIVETHSVSAGLDYPGRRPGARLAQGLGTRRVRRRSTTTRRSPRSTTAATWRASSRRSSPATRSPTRRSSRRRSARDRILLVNLSGRGDKDIHTVAERSGLKF